MNTSIQIFVSNEALRDPARLPLLARELQVPRDHELVEQRAGRGVGAVGLDGHAERGAVDDRLIGQRTPCRRPAGR